MGSTLAENRKDRDTLLVASQLLKDNGIKTRIIKTYLPAMNQLINQYLQSMDFYVNFTLNENFEEIIKSRYRDVFSYDSFSEGEKSRIDIALLLTWRSIAKLKNSVDTNLLILDEIFDSSLDQQGGSDLGWILRNFDDNTNVYVISHRDSLEGKFERTLTAEKEKNFSCHPRDSFRTGLGMPSGTLFAYILMASTQDQHVISGDQRKPRPPARYREPHCRAPQGPYSIV